MLSVGETNRQMSVQKSVDSQVDLTFVSGTQFRHRMSDPLEPRVLDIQTKLLMTHQVRSSTEK